MNLYAYVRNNLLKYLDPTGENAEMGYGYFKAVAMDPWRCVKHRAMSAVKILQGISKSELTGEGVRLSGNIGIAKARIRTGYNEYILFSI